MAQCETGSVQASQERVAGACVVVLQATGQRVATDGLRPQQRAIRHLLWAHVQLEEHCA